jgi:IS605 OrfB family transposase
MNIKTYNIELQMSETTRNHWMSLLAQTRDAFNACADMVTSAKTPLSIVSVHAQCYNVLREQFTQVPSQGIIRVQKSVLAMLRSIRGNKHKDASIPQMKSLALQLDKRLYSNFSINGISLSNGMPQKREKCTFVLYDKVRELFSTCVPKDPTIFARNGRLFLSVPFEVQSLPCKDETAIGVDLGMKRFFVTSEGKSFVDKEYLKQRRRLRYLKRCLQSKGTKSAKRHFKSLSHKERNVSKNQVEKACNVLLRSTDASILVLEDLTKIKVKTSKTKEGFKRSKHNNALSQVPFFLFKERLTHKAQLVGKRVETVSPAFTSQTDSRTNKRDGIRKGCNYVCSDGVVLDADYHAAVNIALRANHPLSSNELPLSGRVQSITQSSGVFNFMASPFL